MNPRFDAGYTPGLPFVIERWLFKQPYTVKVFYLSLGMYYVIIFLAIMKIEPLLKSGETHSLIFGI
ncbi:hypothetical protein J53TS2_02190 [Paenibacillus sp. J53TS2]|nr:hypothetical protein J53TS2_02190 [Paenibacillus sp. J53TS2]